MFYRRFLFEFRVTGLRRSTVRRVLTHTRKCSTQVLVKSVMKRISRHADRSDQMSGYVSVSRPCFDRTNIKRLLFRVHENVSMCIVIIIEIHFRFHEFVIFFVFSVAYVPAI